MKLTEAEELAYKQFVHNPTDSYNALVALAKRMYKSTGISSGSANLDKYVIPTRGPWVRLWVGAPGQGKSTHLRIVAWNEANKLVMDGLDDKFYVAHITYEEAVDAQEIYYQGQNRSYTNESFWRGNVDPSEIIKSGLSRPELPIYWLGESMARSNPDSPPMTVDLCLAGMRAIWKVEKKLPSCIVLDYVQEVEVDLPPGAQRTQKVIEAMKQIIRMGTLTGCAIELGAQARRNSLNNNPPLPNADDIEWAHYVYQKATNVIGVWRPWTTHSKDMNVLAGGVPVNNKTFTMSPMLSVAAPLKHRPGVLGPSVPMLVDPTTLTIRDFTDIGV